MFDLNNAKDKLLYITKDDILNKVSEYDIWRYYCKNFEEIDKPFLSELYNDRNPACRIKHNSLNRLIYKDFGEPSHVFDCFSYIQQKYSCTLPESLRIIHNDFKLGSIKIDIIPQLVLNNPSEGLKRANKAFIEIVPQPFTIVDYKYWEQFRIPLTKLEEYDVFSCKIVYLHTKDGRTITFDYKDNNPIYAYRFTHEGKYSYKIYFPLSKDKKHKWLFSGGSQDDIEGFDQLPLHSDTLILTKSLKDCICYNLIGYPAISLQGETNKLQQDFVNKLYKRFYNIIVNYDNDEEGMKGTNRLNIRYGFKYFYVDEFKDLSDYIKNKGLLSAKRMINKKIREL